MFNRFWKWLCKYSDDLANFFGGIFSLCVGYILFALIIYGLDAVYQWNLNYEQFYITTPLLVIALIVAVFSLGAMFLFAFQVPKVDEEAKNKAHENAVYIISEWSLKTLKAAGVGNDIINYLDVLRKTERIEKLEMIYEPESTDNWLGKLKKDLGETRVEEFEETILKYTRRDVKVSATT